MTQEELAAHIAAVTSETDNAFATLEQVDHMTVDTRAQILAGLAAITAILNGTEQATSVEFFAGTPREQR